MAGLVKTVHSEMRGLLLNLRALEVTRGARKTHDEHISKAVTFIKRSQNPDGSWGLGALIDTTMSLRALGLWTPEATQWSLPSGEPGGIDRAFKWLDEHQTRNCWENNLWDTSAVIRAAALHRQMDRPSIVRAVRWIEDQEQTMWGLDEGLRPHYAAQALLALLEAGSTVDVGPLRQRLYSVILDEPDLPRRSLYIAGQVLEALMAAGENPADPVVKRFTQEIDTALQSHEVSIANFLDICAAFLGLGQAYGAVDSSQGAIQETLSKLLNPNRLRDDGSWYRDVTLSAWALVSLSTIQTVRIVEGFPVVVYGAVEDASQAICDAISDDVTERRWLAAASVGCGIAITTLVASMSVQLWGLPRIPQDTNAGWAVVSLAASSVLFFGRLMLTRILR